MKKIILIAFLLVISACSTTKTNVVPVVTKLPIYQPGNPRPMVMKDFKWQVLENKNLDALLTESKKNNKQIVLFALNTNDFENLGVDMQELKRYIQEQQEIIKYYKNAANTDSAPTKN